MDYWVNGSTIVLVAANDAIPADNINLVDELVLHKNGQVKNICTLYLILWPYCLQKIIKNG